MFIKINYLYGLAARNNIMQSGRATHPVCVEYVHVCVCLLRDKYPTETECVIRRGFGRIVCRFTSGLNVISALTKSGISIFGYVI